MKGGVNFALYSQNAREVVLNLFERPDGPAAKVGIHVGDALASYDGKPMGCRADLAVWETERPEDIVAALAPPRLVVKAGRVTVEHERMVKEPWRGLR